LGVSVDNLAIVPRSTARANAQCPMRWFNA